MKDGWNELQEEDLGGSEAIQYAEEEVEDGGQEEDGSRMPWGTLWILYAVIVSEAIVMTSSQTFVAAQCQEQFGVSEDAVGNCSGLLVGGFNFAVFFSSFLIGHLADMFGRKRLILMGLLTGAVCTLGYGMAPNMWVALFFRVAAGLTNSNLGLVKAVIGDITVGKSKALSYAYLSASFQMARAFSGSFGGLLTEVYLPGVPLLSNRFFFPCLLGAIFNAISFGIVLGLLPETFKGAATLEGESPPQDEDDSSATDTSPIHETRSRWRTLALILRKLWEGLQFVAKDFLIVRLLLVFSVHSFGNGGFLLAMILIYDLKREHGGLSYDSFEIGMILAWFALSGSLFQIMTYKWISLRMRLVNIYRCGLLSYLTVIPIFPCLVVFYSVWGFSFATRFATAFALLAINTLASCSFMVGLASLSAMQSHATPAHIQGLVLGLNESTANLCRGIGPVVIGASFSLSLMLFNSPLLPFVVLFIAYVICLLLVSLTSREESYRVEGLLPPPVASKDAEDSSHSAADLASKNGV